jgi:hypothetical protein
LRDKYPGIVLAIECGYKFQFFDQDALIAHDVLKIGVFTKTHGNLASASVPVQRIYFHVRRLVRAHVIQIYVFNHQFSRAPVVGRIQGWHCEANRDGGVEGDRCQQKQNV